MLAKHALNPIEKKLKGIYSASKERQEKEISTSNLVQMLIQEATNSVNLVSGQCINESSTLTFALRQGCTLVGQHGIKRNLCHFVEVFVLFFWHTTLLTRHSPLSCLLLQ